MPRHIDPSLIPPYPTLEFETTQWEAGLTRVAGIDEAGRGALAGPLCAAAVVLPPNDPQLTAALFGVRDSKQMTAFERETWAIVIRETAVDFGIGWVEPGEIDRLGMARCGRLAFTRALEALNFPPTSLLLDYFPIPESDLPQLALVKGDQRSLSIACASVLAKTARDALMVDAHDQYPGYGFAEGKGYATPQHIAALRELGLSTIHRRTFCEGLLQLSLFDLHDQPEHGSEAL